jgi:hypothetical protein
MAVTGRQLSRTKSGVSARFTLYSAKSPLATPHNGWLKGLFV